RLASFGVEDGEWVDVRFSNVADGRTDALRVTNLGVFSVERNAVTMTWTQVNDGEGEPASYRVKYGSPLGSWATATVGCDRTIEGTAIGETMMCTIEGLATNTVYEVQLASFRSVDGTWTNVQYSNVRTVRTGGAVLDLSPLERGATSLSVIWTEIAD